MVRTVRETCSGANMNPPNQPPFVTTNGPDTEEPEFQAECIAWFDSGCAQSHRSLFSALPAPEHPFWAPFRCRPMILDNQTTAANARRQPQHNLFGESYPTVCYPQSTPAELDSWQVAPSNPSDRFYQHAPSVVDNTHIRPTPFQSTRATLPRLEVPSSQVSAYAYASTTNVQYSRESGLNGQYGSTSSDFLQPHPYQGRSPSSSSSDECHSPGSDSSWVDVATEDVMDIDWTDRVPKEHSNLSSRPRSRELPSLGRIESNSGRERSSSVSGVLNDCSHNVPTSGITSAGLSHVPKPTRCSFQTPRDTKVEASQSGDQGRLALIPRHDQNAVSTFNDIACLRCQVKRVTCVPYGDKCLRCQNDLHAQAIHNQRHLCYRAHLADAKVYRTSAVNFPNGIPRLDGMNFVPKRTIRITLYNVGFAERPGQQEQRPRLDVVLREFHAIPGIPVRTSWMDGSTRKGIDTPRYAIPTNERTRTAEKLDAAIRSSRETLLVELQCGRDEIISCGLAEAAKHFGCCDALDEALYIAIMTRLISKSFNIVKGHEALRLVPVLDPSSPLHGRIPIPPMLDAQIDSILMEKMKSRQRHGLSKLKNMMMSHSKEHWFMIFLTLIVLLSNLEFLYQNQTEQIKRYGTTPHRVEAMMQSWKHAAENLTAHYREVCHGARPFHEQWVREAQQSAKMSDADVDFLARLKGLVEPRGEELRRLAAGQPGHPLVWVSALFF